MATATQADFPVPTTWTELTATITGAVSTACVVQNITTVPVYISWGDGSAPSSSAKTGSVLASLGDSFAGTAAKIWVRAYQSGAAVSVTLT